MNIDIYVPEKNYSANYSACKFRLPEIVLIKPGKPKYE